MQEFKDGAQSTSLLQEMLSAFVILVQQLQDEVLAEQEKFDTLANLIVIFSKIVKQRPELY